MLDFQLKPDNFADWTGLHRLLTETFSYMDERIDPPSSLKTFDAEGLKRKADEEALLVVFDDGKLVACAYLGLEEHVVYIGKVAVAHSHRGKGIARRIFDMAKDYTRQQGRGILELETRIELVENHETFAKLGFVKTAETSHAGYERPTAITMQCRV